MSLEQQLHDCRAAREHDSKRHAAEIEGLRRQNRLHDTWHGELQAEIERLRGALRRIATQGLGRWDSEQKRNVDAHGEPWKHWANRAREALSE